MLRLERLVLALRDGAGVEQRLRLRDLVGRGGLRNVADVVLLRFLRGLDRLRLALAHAGTAHDQVHEWADYLEHKDENDPEGFVSALELVVAEDVAEDREDHHDVGDEHEEREAVPDDVPDQ